MRLLTRRALLLSVLCLLAAFPAPVRAEEDLSPELFEEEISLDEEPAEEAAEPADPTARDAFIDGIIASGKKLFDTSAFFVAIYDDGAFWKAEMTPKRRDMKRMFSQLVFHFDKKTQVIDCVEFVEPKGDKTTIQFKDVRLNQSVEESLFNE